MRRAGWLPDVSAEIGCSRVAIGRPPTNPELGTPARPAGIQGRHIPSLANACGTRPAPLAVRGELERTVPPSSRTSPTSRRSSATDRDADLRSWRSSKRCGASPPRFDSDSREPPHRHFARRRSRTRRAPWPLPAAEISVPYRVTAAPRPSSRGTPDSRIAAISR